LDFTLPAADYAGVWDAKPTAYWPAVLVGIKLLAPLHGKEES